MIMRINDNNVIYDFSENNKYILKIKSGETVEFETKDCLSNALKDESDKLSETSFDKSKVNPATGPVYIEDAEPGNVLEVKIERIRFKETGVITCQENLGIFGDWFNETTFKITPIIDGKVIFDSKVSIPVNPMIGVMGVAPKGFDCPAGLPGNHGGNMDNTMVKEKSTLYLPVYVKGALFAVGDVHAAMGDGEINCSAIEAAAFVTLTFNVRKDLNIGNPILSNEKYLSTIASDESLDMAVQKSVMDMGMILEDKLPIKFEEITMLMSAVGESQICQIVSPLKTARYLMPLRILNSYGFRFKNFCLRSIL